MKENNSELPVKVYDVDGKEIKINPLMFANVQPFQQANQNNPYSSMGNMNNGNALVRGLNFMPENVSEAIAINGYPLARSITVNITSTLGVGSIDTTVRIFNEQGNSLNNAVTDNGSGAGSIVSTYQDGNGGRQTSQLLSNARYGLGMVCIGVALRFTNVTTPASSTAAQLANSSPVFITRSMFAASPLTLPFDPATMQFRPDNTENIEYMPCRWNITNCTQFEFLMPGAAAITFSSQTTFYFPAN